MLLPTPPMRAAQGWLGNCSLKIRSAECRSARVQIMENLFATLLAQLGIKMVLCCKNRAPFPRKTDFCNKTEMKTGVLVAKIRKNAKNHGSFAPFFGNKLRQQRCKITANAGGEVMVWAGSRSQKRTQRNRLRLQNEVPSGIGCVKRPNGLVESFDSLRADAPFRNDVESGATELLATVNACPIAFHVE